MVAIGPFSVATGALTDVGMVLAEAMILYVVYGVLTAALSDRIVETIEGM